MRYIEEEKYNIICAYIECRGSMTKQLNTIKHGDQDSATYYLRKKQNDS